MKIPGRLSRLFKLEVTGRDLCPHSDGHLRAPAVPSMIERITLEQLLLWARLSVKHQRFRSQQNSTAPDLVDLTL